MDLILIISARFNQRLTEIVYQQGMIPLVYSDMELALFAVRRTVFKAVLINGQRNNIDVLETALNLRDINSEIPILIVGMPADEKQKKILEKLDRVQIVVDEDGMLEKIIQQVRRS